jgi:hypothetical protein
MDEGRMNAGGGGGGGGGRRRRRIAHTENGAAAVADFVPQKEGGILRCLQHGSSNGHIKGEGKKVFLWGE